MARYAIKIDLGNAAFEDGNEGAELGALLRKLADDCEGVGGGMERFLMDSNGNRVGEAKRTR